MGLIANLDNTIQQVLRPQDALWKVQPVPFSEFVESEEHLCQAKLSAAQRGVIEEFMGNDPKKIFDETAAKYTMAVLLWGKGSGKDLICTEVQAYISYVTLCMRSPQVFFGLAPDESLDCINVSPAHGQATSVYFHKFKSKLVGDRASDSGSKGWRWLFENYTITDGGKRINDKGMPEVHIGSTTVTFPGNIRAHAYHSQNESYEGFNVIFWIMDEASAFKDKTEKANAQKVFNTLRTSATSRFGNKWKGFMVSYPRSEDDFTMRMAEIGRGDPKILVSGPLYTWQVRPEGTFSSETFEFEGEQVPIDFVNDFRLSPEDSKCKYMCKPPKVIDAFFKYPIRINECIVPDRRPLFETEDMLIENVLERNGVEQTRKNYIGKRLEWVADGGMDQAKVHRVIHVDAGLTSDRAALIMAHGEQVQIKIRSTISGTEEVIGVNKVVVDGIIIWEPDPSRSLQVSLNNIETIIFELKKYFNLVRVSYDQWNSQTSLEMLQANRISAEMHTITAKDYAELRTMTYAGAVELLPQSYTYEGMLINNKPAELLIGELGRLKLINGTKVDHPTDGSKDIADCLAGVNRLLNEPTQKQEVNKRMPRSTTAMSSTPGMQRPFSAESTGIQTALPSMPGAPQRSRLTPAPERGFVFQPTPANGMVGQRRTFPRTMPIRGPMSSPGNTYPGQDIPTRLLK